MCSYFWVAVILEELNNISFSKNINFIETRDISGYMFSKNVCFFPYVSPERKLYYCKIRLPYINKSTSHKTDNPKTDKED